MWIHLSLKDHIIYIQNRLVAFYFTLSGGETICGAEKQIFHVFHVYWFQNLK